LTQLDRENLGRPHLDVQELDHLAQFWRNAVGDEQHPNPPSQEIGFDLPPEGVEILVGAKLFEQDLGGAFSGRLAADGEALAQFVRRPVENGVGGIIKHLANHLPADSGVGPPFDLNECGDAVLIQEEVIQRPATGPAGLAGNRLLPVDQHEPAWVDAIDLVPRQKGGKTRQEILEVVFRGEARRLHRHQRARLGQYEYSGSSAHVGQSLIRSLWRFALASRSAGAGAVRGPDRSLRRGSP
jgi:hypothetical protein